MDTFNLGDKIIAVIDDDEKLLGALGGFFESYGARVITYNNGPEFLLDMPFTDCIVLDYYMRFLDGLALIKELRSRGYCAPVILFTGLRSEISKSRLAGSDVRQVVDKLSGYEELLRAVHAAVRANSQ